MTTAYPGALDDFPNPVPSTQRNAGGGLSLSTQQENQNDAIEAIQATLGTNPQGGSATVKARIAAVEATAASKEATGTAAALLAAHEAASNPHPGYLTPAEGDAAYPPLSRTITAGVGLAGGGTLSANLTINLDLTELAEDTSPDAGADYVVTYDASAAAHKKVLLSNLPGGAGGAPTNAQYLVLAANGTLSGERVITPVAPLAGVDGGAGGAYQIGIDLVSLTAGDPIGTDYLLYWDGVAGALKRCDVSDIWGGGTSYTDENAQDAVGGILTDDGDIDFTYDDLLGRIYASTKANSQGAGKLTATATDILYGRASSGAGAGEEIPCTAAGRALLAGASAAAQRTTLGVPPTSLVGSPCELLVAVSDESTVLTAGTNKLRFRMPYAMTVTEVRASLNASGTGTTVDINEGGASILSTKLTFDSGETTTTTAATPAVISDAALADDAEISIDIDATAGNAAGLKVLLKGTRA